MMHPERRALVLRDAEVARACEALRAGTGVIAFGRPGSGRSSFVEAVLAELSDTTRQRIWVGDDVDRLDHEQAEGLVRAVAQHKIVPLLTARHQPLSESLQRLRRGETLSIELGPLSSYDLLRVAESWLGGSLDPRTAPILVPARGGHDLSLLRAVVDSARQSGTIDLVDGYWQASSPLLPDVRVREVIRCRLPGADDVKDSNECLVQLIALAPGLTIGSLVTAAHRLGLHPDPVPNLESLEEAGIIESSHDSEPRIRLRDGVLELAASVTVGVLKRHRLCGVIVDVLSDLPATQLTPDELLTLAEYSLGLGRHPDATLVRRAAVASFRSPDARRSLRLATAAVDLDPSFDAQMTLAAAESQLGRTREALMRLESLVTAAGDDVQRGQALRALTTIITERDGDPERALALHQSALSMAAPDSEPVLHINASKGFMLYALGDSVGAARLIEPSLSVLEGGGLAQAYFVVGNSALLRGSLARAHETLDTAQAILKAAELDSSTAQLQRAFVMSFEGRLPESLALVEGFRSAASTFGQWIPQALCTWAIGGVLLSMGRAPEAVAELRSAIALMERIGTARTALLTRTDLARALAVGGDAPAAREALGPARQQDQSVFDLDAKGLQALGWIEACEGDLPEAAASFIRAADAYGSSGHDLPELMSLHEAARAGAARVVHERAQIIAKTAEGTPAAAAMRHIRALAAFECADTDPSLADEFADIARLWASLSLHIIAAEAYATAASLHSALGDARHAAADDRLRAEQLGYCGISSSPLSAVRVTAPLSEREIEIASLAALGSSNREIATKLVISVRTVETHLQRVYAKIGIRSRGELPTALGRWSEQHRAGV